MFLFSNKFKKQPLRKKKYPKNDFWTRIQTLFEQNANRKSSRKIFKNSSSKERMHTSTPAY